MFNLLIDAYSIPYFSAPSSFTIIECKTQARELAKPYEQTTDIIMNTVIIKESRMVGVYITSMSSKIIWCLAFNYISLEMGRVWTKRAVKWRT